MALEPGRHERRWAGRDRSGRALEAGVYFVRVEARSLSSAHGLSVVQKIVLIKYEIGAGAAAAPATSRARWRHAIGRGVTAAAAA